MDAIYLDLFHNKGKGGGFMSWSQADAYNLQFLPRWSLEMAPLSQIDNNNNVSLYSAPSA